MDDAVFKVSECIALINQTLESAYPFINVEGEVASFKVSRDKYVFFDLKDEESTLPCFMTVYQLRMILEDGMKVRVRARPRLTQWGKFSLTVQTIQPVGAGSIKRNFELLKQKLSDEGLFAPARKRSLPPMPKKVGVISSQQAAGLADFLKILDNRWSGLDVTVIDVAVQGESAVAEVISAFRHFNEQENPPELIALVRGGGSLEDLQTFNDEALVREIAASRIPTVVGVGHEVDVTLADLAADVRAATPSNAAEIIVPDKNSLLVELKNTSRGLAGKLQSKIDQARNVVSGLESELSHYAQRLIEQKMHYLDGIVRSLNAYNPRDVLRRGYSLVRSGKGVVKSARQLKVGDKLMIEFQVGNVESEVTDVQAK